MLQAEAERGVHQPAHQRQRGQYHQRDGHHRRGFVGLDVLLPAGLAEEDEDELTSHVEGGE